MNKTPEQIVSELMFAFDIENIHTARFKRGEEIIIRLIAEAKAEQAEEDGNDIISNMTQHPHPTEQEMAMDAARANDAVFLTKKGITLRQQASKGEGR